MFALKYGWLKIKAFHINLPFLVIYRAIYNECWWKVRGSLRVIYCGRVLTIRHYKVLTGGSKTWFRRCTVFTSNSRARARARTRIQTDAMDSKSSGMPS